MPSSVKRVRKVPHLARRDPQGFKNQYGHVLVVGGSSGMIGAMALATSGALRGGAGLVTFACPRTIQQTVAGLCPCALSMGLACDEAGTLAPRSVRQMLHDTQYDVLAIGPGMGRGLPQRNLVRAALEQEKPLVVDADALNNLCDIEGWPTIRACPMILTPHPGELGRLTGASGKQVQADRQGQALAAIGSWMSVKAQPPIVLVLKGAGTIVTDGRRLYVNATGNPGMATGGSGDVLTGLAAALTGQGLEPFEAACLAVWAHGRAGDLAARELGEVAMIASDLLDCLPAALKEASGPSRRA